jgi:hypothetical protein
MIIALFGKNGVGKDTVGICMQYIIWKDLVKKGELPASTFSLQNFKTMGYISKYHIAKFANVPNRYFATHSGINYLSLPRDKKEELRPKFIEYCEFYKKLFGDNVWVKAFDSSITDAGNYIITDFRFEAERKYLESKNALLVQVVDSDNSGTGLFNYTIVNNGTKEELIEKVEKCLVNLGVIKE